jgi:hypothetical protein
LLTVLAGPTAERHGVAAMRERVLRDYSWDAAADATERLYNQLLNAAAYPAAVQRSRESSRSSVAG